MELEIVFYTDTSRFSEWWRRPKNQTMCWKQGNVTPQEMLIWREFTICAILQMSDNFVILGCASVWWDPYFQLWDCTGKGRIHIWTQDPPWFPGTNPPQWSGMFREWTLSVLTRKARSGWVQSYRAGFVHIQRRKCEFELSAEIYSRRIFFWQELEFIDFSVLDRRSSDNERWWFLQVVAPFPGSVSLESVGGNTVVLVPSEGSLKDIVIYISNIEPNSTISVDDNRAVRISCN